MGAGDRHDVRDGHLWHGVRFGVLRDPRECDAVGKTDERASLLSAYSVVGYLAFSLPAVLAGFLAPIVGLTTAADVYGIGVIVLAVGSLAATTMLSRKGRELHNA